MSMLVHGCSMPAGSWQRGKVLQLGLADPVNLQVAAIAWTSNAAVPAAHLALAHVRLQADNGNIMHNFCSTRSRCGCRCCSAASRVFWQLCPQLCLS